MSPDLSKPRDEVAIRTFLAIALPDSIKQDLARLQSSFVDQGSMLKWSDPRLLHITVRFLGAVPADRMQEVKDAAGEAAAGVPPFTLAVSGIGAFPNSRAPRVIWVGLVPGEELSRLERLFRLVEDALASRGFPSEQRAFSPHITLARTRDRISGEDRRVLGLVLQQVQATHDVSGQAPVGELLVMRSDLSRAGPRYTALASLALTGEKT